MLEVINRPNWGVIKNGSSEYIKKIIRGFENKINLSTPVKTVARKNEGIEIQLAKKEETLKFDSVIFATHSDQALEMLENPTDTEKDILSSIPYQKMKFFCTLTVLFFQGENYLGPVGTTS